MPIRLFALVGDPDYAAGEEFQALAQTHAAMVAAIDAGEKDKARDGLAACRAKAPERLADVYDRFAERIEVMPQHASA